MKDTLEKIFDIPFVVESGMDSYPWVRIAPKGAKGQMFSVKVTNRADVRLIIAFEPQAFSAALIASMGRSVGEKRDAFCDSVRLQMLRGGVVSMQVNGVSVAPTDPSTWPAEEWRKLDCQTVVVLPENIAGEHNLVQSKIREWGCLVMGTFLTLVKIDLVDREPLASPKLPDPQSEGDRFSVVMNRYERSAVNRYLCIAKHGAICAICGFDFKRKYGTLGDGFIHVHHIFPVSMLGVGYQVNPETDLIPVCPNCHAMLHRKYPPYSPEEIEEMITRAKRIGLCNTDHLYEYSEAASGGDSSQNIGDKYDADR